MEQDGSVFCLVDSEVSLVVRTPDDHVQGSTAVVGGTIILKTLHPLEEQVGLGLVDRHFEIVVALP